MRNQLTKLYNAVSALVTATQDALAERLQNLRDTPSLSCNRMTDNMRYGRQERLKYIMEKEAEEEEQQREEEDINLTPHDHERPLKGAYKSFVIPGTPKTDIHRYFDQTKPDIKTLIKNQLKEMRSPKIIMTLLAIWRKPIKLLIDLDPEDLEDIGDKVRPVTPMSASPQEIDEEMKKSRPVIKNKLNEWHDWLVDFVPKPIKNPADKVFLRAKSSILGLYDGVKKTLKGNQGQANDNTDLTTHENEEDGYARVDIPFNSLMIVFSG